MLLRDNSTVTDPRLGRIKSFDARSRNFPIRALVGNKPPRSYTWSVKAWLDQGQEGSCVGHAWAHELCGRPAINMVDHKFAREKVYWEAQKIDEYDGGAYPGAAPFSEGTSVLAGAKIISGLGYMPEYRWAFGIDDLILSLGYNGPAVLGINWYQDMFRPSASGLITVGGSIAGGHAILCNGYNVKTGLFRLHNSWGKDWGIDGEVFVSHPDMDRLLREDGEACIPVRRKIIK